MIWENVNAAREMKSKNGAIIFLLSFILSSFHLFFFFFLSPKFLSTMAINIYIANCGTQLAYATLGSTVAKPAFSQTFLWAEGIIVKKNGLASLENLLQAISTSAMLHLTDEIHRFSTEKSRKKTLGKLIRFLGNACGWFIQFRHNFVVLRAILVRMNEPVNKIIQKSVH